MSEVGDIPAGIDERVERLICRCLDSEASADERAELAGILLQDSAARLVYEEYRRVDQLAGAALRQDVAGLSPSAAPAKARGWRLTSGVKGWRVGLAAALSTAAAVVAISVLPSLWSSGNQLASNPSSPTLGLHQDLAGQPVRGPRVLPYHDGGQFDFVNDGGQPFTRLHDLTRDVIGIRGKNDNQIYIFERDKQSTKLIPVSGDI